MPATSPSTRWIIYGAVLALALAGIWLVKERDGPSALARARAQAKAYPAADPPSVEDARIPELKLERLALRAQRDTDADPFNARSWEALAAEEPRRNAPPPPPPPRAPPLPFRFMGKLIDGDGVAVFLTTGERNWVVRAGDTIDGTYRVQAIGEQKMTLTYLALQIPQELAIGEPMLRLEARSAASTADALPAVDPLQVNAPLPGQASLLFAAPSRVAAGTELVVSVGLPPGNAARAARVEIAYDARVLAAVDVPSHDAGRLTIELAGAANPLARVRFRVIGQSPTSTRIGVDSATATDERGASLPLAMPRGQDVAIVRAGG